MTKVEVFDESSAHSLKSAINKFLEKIDARQIISVEYSTCSAGTQYSITTHYSALIIYTDKIPTDESV